ncbi:MAG: DNA recombination protein RmuC [Patescibacteria group bacterium]|jgi:DNA recombination protein RmuC
MLTFLIILTSILTLICSGLAYYLIKINKKLAEPESNENDKILHERIDNLNQYVSQNLNQTNKSISENLNQVTKTMLAQISSQTSQLNARLNDQTGQLNERLKENSELIQKSQGNVGSRLDNAAKVVSSVQSKLAQMEESNKKIFEVGKDIRGLQEILKAPKLRGSLGELFLGDLLSQTFSKNHYQEQYMFKSGEKVDAVIKLKDNMLVPIDAKFPLENFHKMINLAKNDQERKQYKKMFKDDVKKHITAISKKYILPDEGTIDYALMYIPAENVYYETIIRDEDENNLVNFAYTKKVFPVSPNSLYIYVQAILLGLKGMQIEEGAKEILHNLKRLQGDFSRFGEEFKVLGSHLNNATKKYNESDKRLGKFNDKLAEINYDVTNKPEKLVETKALPIKPEVAVPVSTQESINLYN